MTLQASGIHDAQGPNNLHRQIYPSLNALASTPIRTFKLPSAFGGASPKTHFSPAEPVSALASQVDHRAHKGSEQCNRSLAQADPQKGEDIWPIQVTSASPEISIGARSDQPDLPSPRYRLTATSYRHARNEAFSS